MDGEPSGSQEIAIKETFLSLRVNEDGHGR
jgi:hypothetical protein